MFTVDVGNSSVGVLDHREESPSLRTFADLVEAAALLSGADAETVGISVSPPRWEALCAAVQERGGRAPRRLSGVPIALADERLATSAGQDRLALALAVAPGPGVVVDAGTAVTVDIVDAEGVYRGGYIAPGATVALSGLSQATHALPPLVGESVELTPGVDTQRALSAGTWGLMLGGVDRLVEEALASLGAAAGRAPLLVTGGWGEAWIARSRHGHRARHEPKLVHEGVRRWAAAR